MDFIFNILIGVYVGFCLCRIFTPSKTDIKNELELEHNAAIHRAFMHGFECGKSKGKEEAIFNKYTPNELRAALDLPPIEGGEKWIIK